VPAKKQGAPITNLFDTVHNCFKRYVAIEPHNHIAFALWALYAHVYDKFEYTPRLALLSPVQEVGKSKTFGVLRLLVPKPEYLIDPSIAALFRIVSNSTLLLDEIDNVKMERSLKAILNQDTRKVGWSLV
jgi:hypothetical protein